MKGKESEYSKEERGSPTFLTRSTRVDLAEDELLELVVHGEDTSSGNTTL
jgi:hypothetical protein